MSVVYLTAMRPWAGRRIISRVGGFAAVLVLVAATAAGAAVPSPYRGTDPTGDALLQRGDIMSYKIQVTSDAVTLTARTRVGSNPLNWTLASNVNWFLNSTGDARSDYDVRLLTQGAPTPAFGWEVDAEGAPGVILCEGPATYLSGNRYRASIPRSCLGMPTKVRATLSMDFLSGGRSSFDWTSWSPSVALAPT